MQLFKKLNNRNFYLFIFFFSSILASVLVLIIERKVLGFGPTYHPDSAHYINFQSKFYYLSLKYSITENFKNYLYHFSSGSLYYSIIHLFYELNQIVNFSTPYRNILKLNILFYAVTNLLILNLLIKKFDREKKIDYKILIIVLFFCFLPYKVHLSIHVLKETLIFFFLTIYILHPNKFTLIISLIFGTPLRLSFGFYYLAFIDFNKNFLKKYYPILFIIIIGVIIWYYKNIHIHYGVSDILVFLENRNLANMGGRDFNAVPNFSEYGYYGLILRVISWPIIFLTGSFMFFSKSIYLYVIGFEIIIMQLLYYNINKKFIFSLGLIVFLCLVAIYANSFTAYLRYCYLAINLYFLKIILNK